jgi:catechol 2,3-dioxygenase-like lactoylglutathione lyase family enzyme
MPDNNCRPEIQDRTAPVSGLVPMLPVSDLERSVRFYTLLGFAVGNRVPPQGAMQWAWLYAPNAPDWRRGPNLMLTRGERPLEPAGPKIVLYLYATNLVTLRQDLLQAGQTPGPIRNPEYLPDGELELLDPDGHCLMIAQRTRDTP